MNRRYTIWVCPKCSESFQFAGFCDSCNMRLGSIQVIPVGAIRSFASETVARSSPVPATLVAQFVSALLDWSRQPSG